MDPMDIDTFGGKIVNSIRLPKKVGYLVVFDENNLKWKYIQENLINSYFLRSAIKAA
jgi:hypothetical protein